MNRQIILYALAFAFTLVCVEESFAQQAQPKSPAVPPMTEAQLIDRFTRILEEQLEKDDVCVSFKASVEIQKRIRLGAVTIVTENAFERLPEADQNFKIFARDIKRLAESFRGGHPIRITLDDIRKKLVRDDFKSSFGLCPLFPICK